MEAKNIKVVASVVALVPALFAHVDANAARMARHAVMPVPRASFLNTRVDTVQQLISQIKASPAVRARYAKLFHVPQAEVVRYVQKNLVESYVPASKTYNVWCVSSTGRLYSVHQHFQAGTRVFALRNGTPVMKWACGNPLVSVLPYPPERKVPVARKPSLPTESVAPFTETIATEVSPEDFGAGLPTKFVTSIPGEASSLVPSQLVAGSTELLVPAAKVANGLVPFLPFAGGAGLVTGSIGGGGGTTTTTDTLGNGGTSSPGGGTVVPEPSPSLTIALGLLPLGALLAMRKRRGTALPIKL